MTNFRDRGFAIADLKLTPEQCDHIALSVPVVAPGRGGVRGLIDHPTVRQVIQHQSIGRLLWKVVGRKLVAVKATLFDKTAEPNWRVAWHQDRMIAVRERLDVDGFTSWASKGGVAYVEPPVQVLQQMLALRVYLDDCGPQNGPLRVIPGSHESGKIAEKDISHYVADEPPVDICVDKGTIVIMRPLLLHCSLTAQEPTHRRILHIEFAPPDAISPLHWEQIVHVASAA